VAAYGDAEGAAGFEGVEAIAAGVLALLAVAGTFLPATRLDALEAGRTFGVTVRGHTQMLLLLAIPLLPAWRLHRRVTNHLAVAPGHAATLDDAPHALAVATLVAAVTSVVLAAGATWLIPAALWPWLLAAAPAAVVAAVWCGARAGATHVMLAAFILWAIGNTIQAGYDANQGGVLAFRHPPGLLALWRTLAAVALLEMPLTAWLMVRPATVDAIAVGSVVASLDSAVRITLHVVAAGLSVAAALLVARLHRPDWFGRPPRRPVAVIRPKSVAPRPATAPTSRGRSTNAPPTPS
jgi:hypothetical protein